MAKEISAEKAKKMLLKEQQERVKRCQEKIQKALEEERCILDCQMIITERGNFKQINIVPLE